MNNSTVLSTIYFCILQYCVYIQSSCIHKPGSIEFHMDETTYDRMKELTEFNNTKAGVKGLVDSGIKKVPRIFIHAPETLPNPKDSLNTKLQIPVIDLNRIDNKNIRKQVVAEVNEAAKSWGFFQVLNHGIPAGVFHNMMHGNKRFHELDADVKVKYLSKDLNDKIRYDSHHLLFTSPASDWRDTLSIIFDGSLKPEELPSVFREEMMEYTRHVNIVAETICELLSEALGLNSNYLKSINSIATQSVVCHYYPPCPEPELTLGTTKHADPALLTILAQDEIGGLQVLHQNQWIPVTPVHGALLCNIGDLLQLISNDRFKSVNHRVLASREGPRLSVATFYSPRLDGTKRYGPIKEVLSDENPPIYKDILVIDYMKYFRTRGLGRDSALNHFKL